MSLFNLGKSGLILLNVLFLSINVFGADKPYVLEGKDCSLTVHETGFDGDVFYTQFYATVSVSAVPGVLFEVEALSPHQFRGRSAGVADELHIRTPDGIWGPYQLDGAFYRIGNTLCRTRRIPRPQPEGPRP